MQGRDMRVAQKENGHQIHKTAYCLAPLPQILCFSYKHALSHSRIRNEVEKGCGNGS